MAELKRQDLMGLEQYADQRADFRARVIEHKRSRKVFLNEHATLYFEDALTIQYQIQEMLRVEKIFEAAAIEEELAAYNPLIPDGSNLKATFMIEYEEETERHQALAKLIGVEDRVWMQVEGFERVFAIADEDLDRENETKTSSVHFLRFEFTQEMVEAAKAGTALCAGIDHPEMECTVAPLPADTCKALTADFD